MTVEPERPNGPAGGDPADGVAAEGDPVEADPVENGPVDAAWTESVRGVYADVYPRLWRAVVAWSGSVDVADDAVSEAFAQLLGRGSVVRDPAAWVWRAGFKLAGGELQRRQAAGRRASGVSPEGDDLRLSASLDRLPDDAVDLVRAMARLTDQQRRCVALVDVAGHTAPSAAAVLDTTAATVRVQLMRARRQLRAALTDPEVPR